MWNTCFPPVSPWAVSFGRSAGSWWVSFIAEWASRIFCKSQVQTGTIWVTICMSFCQHYIEHICWLVKETWVGLGVPRRIDRKTGLRRRLSQMEQFLLCESACNSIGFPSLVHEISKQPLRRLCSCVTLINLLWKQWTDVSKVFYATWGWKAHSGTSKFHGRKLDGMEAMTMLLFLAS